MFIREWGIWGQAGETAWRWDLSPRPAHRMPERAPATSTGDPQEVWCWQGAPAAGVLSPGLVSPVSPTTCSSHAAGCQAGRSHLSGPLTGARLPGESRGVLISRRGMPAAHRSPLPRLCQYLEPCGSRLAAGAPPLQSTHRHSPSSSLGWTAGRPSHQLRQPLHPRSDGGTVIRTSSATAAGSIRVATPRDDPLRGAERVTCSTAATVFQRQ